MTDNDRVMALWRQGMTTEGLGPQQEWDPLPKVENQQRHALFWALISELISHEGGKDGDYDDLPSWMTEHAANALELNGL